MNSRKTIRYTMEDVAPAVAMLQKGGLVALPTETVYGLAVNAENSAAVWVLYEVKQREREKALSVLVTGMEMVENYCQNIPPQAYALAEHYWPGPLTMILEDKGVVSALVNDGSGTLGVRCPDHPLTQAILRQAGVALAAPSANPSDQPSPKTAQEVLDYFDGHTAYRRQRQMCIRDRLRGSWTAAPAGWGWSLPSWTSPGRRPRSSGRGASPVRNSWTF